jgi:hypothetical protein
MSIEATDVTGQKLVKVKDIDLDGDDTIGELVVKLLPKMKLPTESNGRPLAYSARLEREGRHLAGAERVADLEPGSRLVLAPSIDAGGT